MVNPDLIEKRQRPKHERCVVEKIAANETTDAVMQRAEVLSENCFDPGRTYST
jgi:hypothetical protein